MELEDNRIGDVIEGEDQLGWSFFDAANYFNIEYIIRDGKEYY